MTNGHCTTGKSILFFLCAVFFSVCFSLVFEAFLCTCPVGDVLSPSILMWKEIFEEMKHKGVSKQGHLLFNEFFWA